MKKTIIAIITLLFFISPGQVSMDLGTCQEIDGNIIYVDDDGGKNYTSISEAVENATDEDTIFVYNGMYKGYFSINKSITLIGENKENTIITSDFSDQNGLITILKNNVTVSGFTIKNSTIPHYHSLDEVDPPTWIYDVAIGIIVNSDDNIIDGNDIVNNHGYGILLNQSHNTTISNNTITKHDFSCIYLKDSSNNTIVNNSIRDNEKGIMFHRNSTNNILYFNNFINNTFYHVQSNASNTFYNPVTGTGNYWDDYSGTDKNNDAIGDSPYNISGGNNQDLYPLMAPYYGRLVIEKYYVDQDLVIYMLWIAMIATIIFSVPIAYFWYRKIR